MKITKDNLFQLQKANEFYLDIVEARNKHKLFKLSETKLKIRLDFIKEYRSNIYQAFKEVVVNSKEYPYQTVQFIRTAESEFTKTSQGLLRDLNKKINQVCSDVKVIHQDKRWRAI